MTQELDKQDKEDIKTLLRPGDILRNGREAQKMSTQDVADHLRLRKQLVEEIEDNKFDPKVAGTFTRGYLRAYAKLVEIPEEEVIAAYYELGIEAPRKDAMQSFSRRTKQQTADSRLMLITYIIAAVIIASVVLFAWQQANEDDMPSTNSMMTDDIREVDPAEAFSDDALETNQENNGQTVSSEQEPEQGSGEDNRSASIDTPEEQSSRETTSLEEIESEVLASEGSSSEQAPEQANINNSGTETADTLEPELAENTLEVVAVAGATIDDVDPNSGELVFFFENDCWVRIDDATGENVASGVKQAGYIMPLTGEGPYRIELGAPEVVEMWYQGQRVDMAQFRQGRVARFTWPVESVEP